MKDALTANGDYYRWLVEHAPDIISVFEMDGLIRFKSPAVERTLGYTPEEMIGSNEFEIIHPDDHSKVRAALDEVSEHREQGQTIEYRVRHKDGSWRFVESLGRTVTDTSGGLVCIVNSRDITGRKRAEMDRRAYLSKLSERESPE